METAPVWQSRHEVAIADAQLAVEQQLRDADASFGERAAATHGKDRIEFGSTERVLRAVRWRIQRRPALAALVASGERARKRLARRVVAGAARMSGKLPDIGLPVVSEPATVEEGTALLAETEADFVVLVRASAEPLPNGMRALADAVRAHPDATLIYGDARGPSGAHHPTPPFAPIRLCEEDYLGGLVAVNIARARALGGFADAAAGALLLGLALRMTANDVVRIPRELAVVAQPASGADSEAAGTAQAAVVRRYLAERGVSAEVIAEGAVRRDVRYPVVGEPLVSIVIPTGAGSGYIAGDARVFVTEAVRSIVARSSYRHLEIVVVADDDVPQHVVDELEAVAGDRLRMVRWSAPFNFSAKVNRGAAVARGELLLVLNDDVELIEPDSIARMVALAQRPEVGLVGALLFFADGRVQHIGQIYAGGSAGHAAIGTMPGVAMPLEAVSVTRVVSGVTAACVLVTRERYFQVGGFSPELPNNYNDVDFCLKIRELGVLAVCCGRARWYHFESASRDARVQSGEVERLQSRWSGLLRTETWYRAARR